MPGPAASATSVGAGSPRERGPGRVWPMLYGNHLSKRLLQNSATKDPNPGLFRIKSMDKNVFFLSEMLCLISRPNEMPFC
jgi:hypothetical protein